MNSATTQHPLHDTPQGVSLRFCCVAPPSPRHHAFCFVWRDFLFVFSVWWWRERGRVSPKGETGGIQIADSVLPKLFSGGKDLAKPRLISRPQKGVWGMNAGGFLPCGKVVCGKEKCYNTNISNFNTMADPKLSEYVKTSLAQGKPKEEIYKELLAQGWTIEIIQESFNSIGTEQEKEDTSKKTISIIVTIGAIFVGAGIFSFIAANWLEMTKPIKIGIILISMGVSYGAGW